MRLPKMRTQTARMLSIADFSGGLNLRDGTSEILDNQLTDTKNMWWRDGVLKTRPGTGKVAEVSTVGYDEYINPKQTDVWLLEYRLFYYNISGMRNSEADYSVTETFGETGFWLQGDDKIIELPAIKTGLVNFVCQKNNTVYAFVGAKREIWKLEFSLTGTCPEAKEEAWSLIAEEDMYVPLVAANCKTTGASSKVDGLCGGVGVEGYNLLGSYYRMSYDAYNPEAEYLTSETLADGSVRRKHRMWYKLLNTVMDDKYKGMKIKVTYTKGGNNDEFEITLGGSENPITESKVVNGLKVQNSPAGLIFYYEDGSQYYITEDDENDIVEIIAPYIPDNFEQEKDKIFNMTRCEWFGGASAGLAGGTRLFLCGNTGEQSLVCWSGLNDPLYFPENSYFYVGNTSSAVTGFGKQSDKLIIFKENETWYTQYYQNTDISAEDLINQSVVDYTSSSVYFPLVQINPNIGCPYPDTVQLCRNRLVWLGDGGNVYTLVSESQYNERSIYCVSDMISPKLRQEQNPDKAVSADFEGLYLLFVQNSVYVMDYESYGYAYVYSHTKTEDAQLKIPWWYWEMSDGEYNDQKVCAVIPLRERLYIVFYPEEPNGLISGFKIKELSDSFLTDDGEEIESSLTTKLFSFSAPQYRKNIDRIDLSLGNNGGEPITVEVITDCGNEEHTIEMLSTQTDKRDAGYIENRAVFPLMRQIARMAVKLSCKGSLIIDGMSIKFRITGGVR